VSDHRLFVNPERTVLVRLWDSGAVEVATRETPSHIWGPPLHLLEERAAYSRTRARGGPRDEEAA
jgi:hypothetical protein